MRPATRSTASMVLTRFVSVFVNGECLWTESCEISDIKQHSYLIALQDTIVDALVSRMEDACLLNWRDIVRAAKEANE